MGKPRIIAETGAGQHGVATATAAALFGLKCQVFMGEEDVRRQRLNVFKMKALGTEVITVTSGSRTLRDAINEAMRDWMATVEHTHYIMGSVVGPHPFPLMVRDFQSVIGSEARQQCLDKLGRLPDVVVACVGGGSNAAGMFYPFIGDASVAIVGVEAGGRSAQAGEHAATLSHGQPGVLHGCYSYVLQDSDGQTAPVHSVSAGLDYPGVGPEHSYWKDNGRVHYTSVTDAEALEAFHVCSQLEGILPALETAHAVVEGMRQAAAGRRTTSWSSAFRVAATRTVSKWPVWAAKRSDMNAIDATFEHLHLPGQKGLHPLHHRWRSGPGNVHQGGPGVGWTGRRSPRDRLPLQRPHRRRSRHSGVLQPRSRPGHSSRRHLRLGAHADRFDGLESATYPARGNGLA